MGIGIGPAELVVVSVIGLMTFGLPIAAVVLIVVLIRQQNRGRMAELQAENDRLRVELAERGDRR